MLPSSNVPPWRTESSTALPPGRTCGHRCWLSPSANSVSFVGAPPTHGLPALILCMGVKTKEKDRPLMRQLAESLSRLGFVVIWPRLAVLDAGRSEMERPETFIAAHEYLVEQQAVDACRVSLVGFSVGASVALVAATHPSIAKHVRAVVFFGGYCDALAYLVSVATGTVVSEGRVVTWEPDDGAVSHIREIFETAGASHVLRLFDCKTREEAEHVLATAPASELGPILAVNPATRLPSLAARLFVLHDRGDPYVPYAESVKLNQALAGKPDKHFLLITLFEHVQPSSLLERGAAADGARLLGFLGEVFAHL
jgi:dienelactone hydrolase